MIHISSPLTTILTKLDIDRSRRIHNAEGSRICSDDNDCYIHLEEFKTKFIRGGYLESEIIEQFNKATQKDREQLLKYKMKEKSNEVVFATKYNRSLPKIGKHLHENWHLLHINSYKE